MNKENANIWHIVLCFINISPFFELLFLGMGLYSFFGIQPILQIMAMLASVFFPQLVGFSLNAFLFVFPVAIVFAHYIFLLCCFLWPRSVFRRDKNPI